MRMRDTRQRNFFFDDVKEEGLPRRREIFVDCFAGGGGASTGIRWGMGRSPDVAINHDPEAVAMHIANHPETKHWCENLWDVDPVKVTEGRRVGGAWFSPDCTDFSKAKGDKPIRKTIRGLAWIVLRWAARVRPRLIFLENVAEFQDWSPIRGRWVIEKRGKRKSVDNGGRIPPASLVAKVGPDEVLVLRHHRIKSRKGETFRKWVSQLQGLGYVVEWRVLTASDYGSPTSRKRLFLIARCDGAPIVWPAATHASPKIITKTLRKSGYTNLRPWRTAAEIIDWTIPCPSIFMSPGRAKTLGLNIKRPLEPKTLARLAEGVRRYAIEDPDPFIVEVNHGGAEFRGGGIRRPIGTVTAKNGYAVASPYVARLQHGGGVRSPLEPLHTVTDSDGDCNLVVMPHLQAYYGGTVGGHTREPGREVYEPVPTITTENRFGVVAPVLVPTTYQERPGQRPRTMDPLAPLGTVVAQREVFGVGAMHVSRMYGQSVGSSAAAPLGAVSLENHSALCSAWLVKHFGGMVGLPAGTPFPTILSRGTQNQVAAAHLTKLNHGAKPCSGAGEPLHTILSGANHHVLTTSHLSKFYGTTIGADLRSPAPTISSQGNHVAEVRAFLMKYYGTGGQWQDVRDPVHTLTAKDRLALGIVVIGGELWQIVDIGMRMLTPRELFLAMGFPGDYDITTGINGKPATKTSQVARCGNAVPPHPAAALVGANYQAKELAA